MLIFAEQKLGESQVLLTKGLEDLQKVRLGLSPGQIDHCILRVSGSIHLYTSSKSCTPGSYPKVDLFILTALFIILCPIMTHLVLSCSCSPAGSESRYWMWWLACSNMQLDSERLNGSYHIRMYQTYHSVYIFLKSELAFRSVAVWMPTTSTLKTVAD